MCKIVNESKNPWDARCLVLAGPLTRSNCDLYNYFAIPLVTHLIGASRSDAYGDWHSAPCCDSDLLFRVRFRDH